MIPEEEPGWLLRLRAEIAEVREEVRFGRGMSAAGSDSTARRQANQAWLLGLGGLAIAYVAVWLALRNGQRLAELAEAATP